MQGNNPPRLPDMIAILPSLLPELEKDREKRIFGRRREE
jgi:hypothetical protein